MYPDDTICAPATPPGVSGLAVLRLSGKDAFAIADKCFRGKLPLSDTRSHTIHYGKFYDNVDFLDTVTASVFRAPHSYTGENTVEFGCHGGMVVSDEIISALVRHGARFAEPGEFTRRAFLNGKMDLTQVEAVADLIHAVSSKGSHVAARQLIGGFTKTIRLLRQDLLSVCALLELELDFSGEDIEFVDKNRFLVMIDQAIETCRQLTDSTGSTILRHGYQVGLAGHPNAGKSTFFNALLNKKRSIVSPIAGTTRDYIHDSFTLNGITISLYDTAGLRSDSVDSIELEGIALTHSLLDSSNLILVINDLTLGLHHSNSLVSSLKERYPTTPLCLIHNKLDQFTISPEDASENVFFISALDGQGVEHIKQYIGHLASGSTERITDVLLNQRHSSLLTTIVAQLSDAKTSLRSGMSNEFVTIDIRHAISSLGEITGEVLREEILNTIFSQFCIGK
jgi:tRNA modification GTPase